jgi:hypothetical protein
VGMGGPDWWTEMGSWLAGPPAGLGLCTALEPRRQAARRFRWALGTSSCSTSLRGNDTPAVRRRCCVRQLSS